MINRVVIKEWISKDSTETSRISLLEIEGRRVVEIEYTSELDRLLGEFKLAKGKKEKGEVREKYRIEATRLNSQYKHPVYNLEI